MRVQPPDLLGAAAGMYSRTDPSGDSTLTLPDLHQHDACSLRSHSQVRNGAGEAYCCAGSPSSTCLPPQLLVGGRFADLMLMGICAEHGVKTGDVELMMCHKHTPQALNSGALTHIPFTSPLVCATCIRCLATLIQISYDCCSPKVNKVCNRDSNIKIITAAWSAHS